MNLADLAFLAGLAKAPSMFEPRRHAQQALKRRNQVLDSLAEMGALTAEQATAAKLEPLNLQP